MHAVLIVVLCIGELYIAYLFIRSVIDEKGWRKVKHEYDACFALERQRAKEIPRRWRYVGRKQARNIVAQLNGNLHIPPVSLRLSCFRYKGYSWANGMYYYDDPSRPSIYLKGFFFFPVTTLIHEVSHHHARYCSNYYGGHGQEFLESEHKVFDVFKALLDNHIVK